ncbi:MAG: hypothetical protein WCH01_11590 [Methylococcaceae bacterium]
MNMVKRNVLFSILAMLCFFWLSQAQAAVAYAPATITSPTNGSTFTSTSVTFNWSSRVGASEYFLYLGTSLGTNNIYGQSQATRTSVSIGGLPNNGSKIYVRLFSKFNTVWYYLDYSYTAKTATATPTLNSPSNNQANVPLNNLSFTWSAITNANYRIVISEKQDFSGFAENTLSCDTTCVTMATTATSISRITPSVSKTSITAGNFANFWWKAGTYYWRVRANTTTGGTSNWSNYRSFTTGSAIKRAIVNSAIGAAGASPLSVIGSPWLTDMSGGDGVRIRNAITTFKTWVDSRTGGGGYASWSVKRLAASTTVRTTMATNLSPSYNSSDSSQLIEQIRLTYAGTVPDTDDKTLASLQIRAQCKEFADRTVALGGGTKSSYTTNGVNIKDVNPGMYAFKSTTHAAIITAVKWDNTGAISNIRLAESNWGTGWSNPGGQVPWLRVVTTTREIPLTGYTAVKTD